ncbi:hypothetical protein AMTRI_Chr05g72140 [Amborella trichopoda]
MICSKRLLQMAHKWQKHAIKQRRRISFEKRTLNRRGGLVADEGHFVVYTIDGSRVAMTEEEFGFTICGPLQVPCVASVMDYIVSLLSKNACVDKEKAMVSITSCIKPLSSLGLHRIISANKILCGF